MDLRRSILIRYKLVHQLLFARSTKKKIVFIVGCQRSGTTMLSRIFEGDLRSKIYGEASAVSQGTERARLRLKPVDEVRRILNLSPASLIVLKPLVESQNIVKLLDYFPGSREIWIYRNYFDVAASNIAKFGTSNPIKDLRLLVKNDQKDWRGENIHNALLNLIQPYFHESMEPADAAALFWLARNSLYFDLDLAEDPRIYLCKYEDLTTNSVNVIERIYKFLKIDFPGNRLVKDVHSQSISRGAETNISSSIKVHTDCMLKMLDDTYNDRFQEKFVNEQR